MKKTFFVGVLVIALVCIGCATNPPSPPSPFEGRWVIKDIEEVGSFSQLTNIFPCVLSFRRNKFGMGQTNSNRDFFVTTPEKEFVYTDTEITISDKEVFRYTLDENYLITESESWGKLVWAKE